MHPECMQYSQKNMELGRADQEKMTQQQDLQQPLPPRVKQVGSQMETNHQHQPPPPQKCPRCDSSNTKFCYYNNYSLSQPRYFCKACRRYWTHGGTLRNVPVGGGCRKSKRPRPAASSSSGSEIARSQSLSTAIPSQNLTGMISGHESLRAFTPAMPSMSNSYLSGGGLLSSLSAMQSLPTGLVNQGAAMHLGCGNSPYGANMALLQGLNFSSLKPEAPRQFQPPNEFFPLHQSLTFPPRPLSSWIHQSFINRDLASSSGVIPSFWRGATADGHNQAGSSFGQNRWPDKHPGFDPSQ